MPASSSTLSSSSTSASDNSSKQQQQKPLGFHVIKTPVRVDKRRYEGDVLRDDLQHMRVESSFQRAIEATGDAEDLPMFSLEYMHGSGGSGGGGGARQYVFGPYEVFFARFESEVAKDLHLLRYSENFAMNWYAKIFADIEVTHMDQNREMDFVSSVVHTAELLCRFVADRFKVQLDPVRDFVYLIASTPEKHSMHIVCHNTSVLAKDVATLGRLMTHFSLYAVREECRALEAQIQHQPLGKKSGADAKQPLRRVSVLEMFDKVYESTSFVTKLASPSPASSVETPRSPPPPPQPPVASSQAQAQAHENEDDDDDDDDGPFFSVDDLVKYIKRKAKRNQYAQGSEQDYSSGAAAAAAAADPASASDAAAAAATTATNMAGGTLIRHRETVTVCRPFIDPTLYQGSHRSMRTPWSIKAASIAKYPVEARLRELVITERSDARDGTLAKHRVVTQFSRSVLARGLVQHLPQQDFASQRGHMTSILCVEEDGSLDPMHVVEEQLKRECMRYMYLLLVRHGREALPAVKLVGDDRRDDRTKRVPYNELWAAVCKAHGVSQASLKNDPTAAATAAAANALRSGTTSLDREGHYSVASIDVPRYGGGKAAARLYDKVQQLLDQHYKYKLIKLLGSTCPPQLVAPRVDKIRRNEQGTLLEVSISGTRCEIYHVMSGGKRHTATDGCNSDNNLRITINTMRGVYWQRCMLRNCRDVAKSDYALQRKCDELNARVKSRKIKYRPGRGKERAVPKDIADDLVAIIDAMDDDDDDDEGENEGEAASAAAAPVPSHESSQSSTGASNGHAGAFAKRTKRPVKRMRRAKEDDD